MTDQGGEHDPWPARGALLAGLGAVLGVVLDLLLKEGDYRWTEDPLRTSAATFVAVGGVAFAVTLERLRWHWSALFGLGCGLTSGLILYANGSPAGWSAGDEWRVFSVLLAVGIAAPLFQTFRDEGHWRPSPEDVHAHAWTNIVLLFACLAFVLISWLLAQLLAELFHLIGIEVLRGAMRKSWFNLAIAGAAFGGAAGLLRDRDKIVGLLQRVVTTVLAVLAPVLAVGLALFVIALPIAGLAPLWEKTSATTPILLSAVAGAFFLVNAVIGNKPAEEAEARTLRLSAMMLAAVMTPLSLVAAISTWLRVDQHGFTPERLWALVFVTAVVAVSLTYAWALVRGRSAWSARIRPANVRLAIGLCLAALLLASPILDFGAIATRDQLARLRSGTLAPDRFDWAALRFDFGPAGKAALTRLAAVGPDALRSRARTALIMTDRWAAREETRIGQDAARLSGALRVMPRQAAVPPALVTTLARQNVCGFGRCILFWEQNSPSAIAVGFPCERCQASALRLARTGDGGWQVHGLPSDIADGEAVSIGEQREALERGEVEIRPVARRQVFIGGKPVGSPFD